MEARLGPFLLEERSRSEGIYKARLIAMIDVFYTSLERLIEMDQKLNALQPIHSGRLRLQWFAYPPHEWHFEGERFPLFVQWRRNFAIGIWRAQRVPISKLLKHQHKSKAFKANAAQVKGLLSQMREMVLIYRQARKLLGQLQGTNAQWMSKQATKLKEPQALLRALDETVAIQEPPLNQAL